MAGAPAPTSGQQLGAFVLETPVGKGPLGQVYRARHADNGHQVAVRVLREDLGQNPFFLEQIHKEAVRVRELNHPHIARLLDGGFRDVPYLVYEWVEGMGLGARLLSAPALTPVQVVEIIIMAAKGLAYAHRRQITHSHLKPGNIMLMRSGLAKVLDFAYPADPRAMVLVGPNPYAAPEIAEGRNDPRSDIYSLGVMLYELLCGHAPFEADTPAELTAMHRSQPIPSLPGCEPNLAAVCQRLLQKDPAQRFQSVELLGRALEEWLQRYGKTAAAMTARPRSTGRTPMAGNLPQVPRALTARAPAASAEPLAPLRAPTQRQPEVSPSGPRAPSPFAGPVSVRPRKPKPTVPESRPAAFPGNLPAPPAAHAPMPSPPASGYPGIPPEPPPSGRLSRPPVSRREPAPAPEPPSEPQGYGGARRVVPAAEPRRSRRTETSPELEQELSELSIFNLQADEVAAADVAQRTEETQKGTPGTDLTPIASGSGSTIETRASIVATPKGKQRSRRPMISPYVLILVGAAAVFAVTLILAVLKRVPGDVEMITVSFTGVQAGMPKGATATFGPSGEEEPVTFSQKAFPPGSYRLVISRRGFVTIPRHVEIEAGKPAPSLTALKIPSVLSPTTEVLEIEELAREQLAANDFEACRQTLEKLEFEAPGYAAELGLLAQLETEERFVSQELQEQKDRERKRLIKSAESLLSQRNYQAAQDLLRQIEEDTPTTLRMREEVADALRRATDYELQAESALDKGELRTALEALREAQYLRPFYEYLGDLEAKIERARQLDNESQKHQTIARNNQAQLWPQVLELLEELQLCCPRLDLSERVDEARSGSETFNALVKEFDIARAQERWTDADDKAREILARAAHPAGLQYRESYQLRVREERFEVLAWLKNLLLLLPSRQDASLRDLLDPEADLSLFSDFLQQMQGQYPPGRVVAERIEHPESFQPVLVEDTMAWSSPWIVTLTMDVGEPVVLELSVRICLRKSAGRWAVLELMLEE